MPSQTWGEFVTLSRARCGVGLAQQIGRNSRDEVEHKPNSFRTGADLTVNAADLVEPPPSLVEVVQHLVKPAPDRAKSSRLIFEPVLSSKPPPNSIEPPQIWSHPSQLRFTPFPLGQRGAALVEYGVSVDSFGRSMDLSACRAKTNLALALPVLLGSGNLVFCFFSSKDTPTADIANMFDFRTQTHTHTFWLRVLPAQSLRSVPHHRAPH